MNIHIVSHTHWDREWYRSFNYFNIKLSYLFDSLFEILDKNKDYKHFMLDGQMVMIEDYLTLRPEHKEKLKKYVQEHRIIIGPWYTQPDEFAPDAESLIRNLLIGINQAKEYGDYMKVGYLPDSFGHSAQLPQILKGFNIDSACIMRGVPSHKLKTPEFKWKAMNGDEVFTVALTTGYTNGMFLPESVEKTDIRMKKILSDLTKYGSKNTFLIMEGVDHQLPNKEIVEYLKSKETSDDKYIHSTLESYMEDTSRNDIQTLKGELITPATNRVHTSMASTRMTQKQANRNMERLLENYVEPYLTLSWLHGAKYPKSLINNAWKILLKNQTHDSICGCCTDEVHKEIDQRFIDIKTIGETLHKINSRAFSNQLSNGIRTITVFNDSLVKGKQIVTAEVYTDSEFFTVVNSEGTNIAYVMNSSEQVDTSKLSIWALYMDTPCITFKSNITFEVDFDFNYGYKHLTIVENSKTENDTSSKNVQTNLIENEFCKVTINNNGTFDVIDKETNQTYKNLNTFEDKGDAGDSYNFSPVENDTVITSSSVVDSVINIEKNILMTTATIEFDLLIPNDLKNEDKERSNDLVSLPVTTQIKIYHKTKRIDVVTTVNNSALNHRLRVLFPSEIHTNKSYAEIQFGVLERLNQIEDAASWKELGFKEKPLPIYSMQRFVSIKDEHNTLSILNKGITEYEIYGNNTIAITLLRSVGYMGKENLSIRPGRPSGVPIPTPDAQCLGSHTFEYSILLNDGNVTNADLTNEAIRYFVDSKAVQNELPLTNLKEKLAPMLELFNIRTLQSAIEDQLTEVVNKEKILSISSDKLVITTIKKAENEDALILRLYNPTEEQVEPALVELSYDIKEIWECNMLEETTFKLNAVNNQFYTRNLQKYTAQTYMIYIKKSI